MPDTLRMITPEDAARATLNGVACHLGRAQILVLVRIAERLRLGARVWVVCAWHDTEVQEVSL
jgi:hypothetical protein